MVFVYILHKNYIVYYKKLGFIMKNLQMVKKHLTKLGYKIAVAESLTTGNIQSKIGSISGATAFYEGGVTTYSLEQKVDILGVNKQHAIKVNCVSRRVAKEMAIGVCNLFGTEISISSTGYAEPYKMMNIKEAFAYYCIWNNITKKVISENKIELNEKSRVSNQILLTHILINELANYLEKNATNFSTINPLLPSSAMSFSPLSLV